MAVDNTQQQKLVRYFKQLGIDPESTAVYLFLLQNGPQTVLAISRGIKTGRTKLYPLLEELADKQLVNIHERHYGTSYEAQTPDSVEFLVSEAERKSEALRSSLPAATNLLRQLQLESPTTSRIVEYRGIDGLKQMNWNLTKADGKFYVYELEHLWQNLGKHFTEKLTAIWADKKITSYDLTNNPTWEHPTEIVEHKENYSKARYIDPKVFTVEFETYIYNNCVALLSYDKADIFGVEIYNDKLARQQKQIFELIWSQAKVLKD